MVLRAIGIPRRSNVGLGSIALYLLFVLELSHRARRLLGAAAWRSLHALAFVLYVASTFHGIAAGSDTGRWGMWLLYLGSAGLVTFLLLLRMFRLIVRPAESGSPQSQNSRG